MKDLVDVIDELDEVIDLLWAAFLATSTQDGRDFTALSRLLNTIHKAAEQARSDLAELDPLEREGREAA